MQKQNTVYKSLFLLLLFLSLASNGQVVLKGNVIDSTKAPIEDASITLYSLQADQKKLVAYTYCNKKGVFLLDLDTQQDYFIKINSFSHKAEKFMLNLKSSQKTDTITKTFVLKEMVFNLEEVTIKTDPPIRVKKDTITIKASSFTDGSEDVVEDLLGKLPGVEVTDDGSISVMGKNVDKVMVEGDDLFERGYKILTKNLNSELIDKIEILQNYSDNPLLKNIQNSNQLALNLVLKEDRKSSFFGNASIGHGTDKFYQNKLNLISFNPISKYYLFGNINTVGEKPIGDIQEIISPFSINAPKFIGDDFFVKDLIFMNQNISILNDNQSNINNAKFASLNTIFNPNEKLKIKLIGYMSADKNERLKNSNTNYFSPIDIEINETDQSVRKPVTGFGKLDATYFLSQKVRLQLASKINQSHDRGLLQNEINQNNSSQKLNTETLFTDQRLTLSSKLTETKAFVTTARFISQNKYQDYTIDKNLFQELFPTTDIESEVRQKYSNLGNFSGIEMEYVSNNNQEMFSLKTGFSHNTKHLTSNLLINNQRFDNDSSDQNMFSNDLKLIQKLFSFDIQYQKRLKNLSFTTNIKSCILNSNINNTSQVRENDIYLVPKIGINWQISKKHKLSLNYKGDAENVELQNLVDGYILQNTRNFKRGTLKIDQLRGNVFLANYTKGDWSDKNFFDAYFVYKKEESFVGRKIELNNLYRLSDDVLLKNRAYYSLNLNLDQYIRKLSSNIKIKGSGSLFSYQTLINNSLQDIGNYNLDYGIELRSAFSSFFNFHIGTSWSTNALTYRNNTNSSYQTNSFIDLIFKPSRKVFLKLTNERLLFKNISEKKVNYFSDLEAKYIIKKNTCSLKFIANNIWNNDQLRNNIIDDLSNSTSSETLIPRYFLLRLDFRF